MYSRSRRLRWTTGEELVDVGRGRGWTILGEPLSANVSASPVRAVLRRGATDHTSTPTGTRSGLRPGSGDVDVTTGEKSLSVEAGDVKWMTTRASGPDPNRRRGGNRRGDTLVEFDSGGERRVNGALDAGARSHSVPSRPSPPSAAGLSAFPVAAGERFRIRRERHWRACVPR